MTDQESTRPSIQGRRLGAELRRLRRLAGLSGREIARRVGIGQATVSRIENAQAAPSLPEVTAWAEAVGASEQALAALVALTEAALNEVDSWRTWMRSGLAAMQADVLTLEASTRTIRNFQPSLVPGLLQTAEYARQVFALVDLLGDSDHAAAVAARLQRQQALYDESRQFEFIITEGVLRRGFVVPAVLVAQLDRIANVATLANVSIAVLPDHAELKAIPWCGFDMYEDREDDQPAFVTVELPHGGLTISDPADVAIYREQLGLLREAAVTGEAAVKLLTRIAADVRAAEHR